MSRSRDLVALTKPRITVMNVLMAAGGFALAEGSGAGTLALVVTGTWLAVGSANALNMVWERESDKLMTRTAHRPLPQGRLDVRLATVFGLALGVLGGALLWLVNPLTAGLGLGALVAYVAIYTPLKRRTSWALLIGALPGAVPPLMGWTAVRGQLDLPGLVLFAILVAWQLPHFLAIAMFRRQDYARAGLKTTVGVRGEAVARAQAVAWCAALVPLSLSLCGLGVASWLYGTVAGLAGLYFLLWGVRGLRADADAHWARGFFRASLVYLPLVTAALALDVALL